jgi:hypothetical protein
MASISDSGKKRGRPSTGIGRSIGLRLYPEQEAKIDAWIKKQPLPPPSTPEAIRCLIDLGLSAHPQEAHVAGRAHPRGLTKGAINQIVDRTIERSQAMQHKDGSAGEKNARAKKR